MIVVARDAARGEAAGEEIGRRVPSAHVETVTADLASLVQVRRLAGEVLARYDRLDVLVNNAGVVTMRRQLTAEGLETTFATNHLVPFLLTNLLRGLLERSAPARIVTVSSAAHKQVRAIPWDGLPRGTQAGHGQTYPLSKLLNILFTVELARRLTGTGVTANCLHPGFVRTALGRDVTGAFGAVMRLVLRLRPGPATGAETSVHLASSPKVAEVSGGYFRQVQACPAKRVGHRHRRRRTVVDAQRKTYRPCPGCVKSDGTYMDRAPLADKDPALGELVDRLAADLGLNSFVLMDHWEDLMAIGLAQPSQHDVLIYVAVKVDDEGEVLTSENRYFYECETPDESDEYGYVVSGRGDHVAYEGVRKAMIQHLQLSRL